MASHRRPKQSGKARATVLTAAAATAVALSAGGAAHADPKPSKSDVKAQLDKLNEQAEAANEKYLGAKDKEKSLQKEVNRLQNQVADEQEALNTLQDHIGQMASAQYRAGGMDPTVQLMLSSHPDQYLDKAQTLDHVSAQQADQIAAVAAQKKVVDRKRSAAESKLATLEKTTKQAAADKKSLQTKVQAAQKLLNSMTAAERAKIRAAEQKAANAAAAKVSSSSSSSGGSGPSVPASGRAGEAIAAAKAQLGKPYVYGATGPGSFDCSGLMLWAWHAAGVNLPRTSQAQAGAGTTVNGLANAKPGDLIIYYSGASHVGMYVGGGQIIHAPHTGAVVRYESATVMPIYKIVRVG